MKLVSIVFEQEVLTRHESCKSSTLHIYHSLVRIYFKNNLAFTKDQLVKR